MEEDGGGGLVNYFLSNGERFGEPLNNLCVKAYHNKEYNWFTRRNTFLTF